MEEKRSQRLMGWPLQLAARLIETKGLKGVLYAKAVTQLGIDVLHRTDLPKEAAPYFPHHLVMDADSKEGEGHHD